MNRNKAVFLYGSPRSGKTTLAKPLADKLGLDHIKDEWVPGNTIVGNSLYVTSSAGAVHELQHYLGKTDIHITAIHVDDAFQLLGPSKLESKPEAGSRDSGPDHYRESSIQPWDAMEQWLTPEEFRGFLKGNALKYLARANRKGQHDEDMQKARHYLDKLAEVDIEASSDQLEKVRCRRCRTISHVAVKPGEYLNLFMHCNKCGYPRQHTIVPHA